MFRPAITSSLLGFALGLIVWTTPLQAEESQVLTLDGIETLKLGLCRDPESYSGDIVAAQSD